MPPIHTIDLHFQGFDNAIAAFLVESSEGPILLETGPHSTLPTLEKGIQALGYELTDIKHVFLTHIHLDHAGAAWAFAEKGAHIYVHPKGYHHLSDPTKLLDSAKRIYKGMMDSLWGTLKPIAFENISSVDDKTVFTIGNVTITAHYTPGHAVHHIAWQINDADLICGDVAGVKIKDDAVVPPCPPPDINIEDWQQSIALIKTLPVERLYLAHFGKVSAPKTHLAALESVLLDWANYIQPHLALQTDKMVLMGQFQAYVKESLLARGMTKAAIARYEIANPSWMSATGLLRYWRKKKEQEENT